MKAKTLQIVWHEKDPVFSIDFHPDGYIATGGGDRDIKVGEAAVGAVSAGSRARLVLNSLDAAAVGAVVGGVP
jgi:hypothetical protein